MSSLVDKIRSRGFWKAVIRPTQFAEKRIPEIHLLQPILEKATVHLRGWPFPFIDPHAQTHIDIDWIGQESEWGHHLEVWRFYQSGQFLDFSGMRDDWRDQSELWPADEKWEVGSRLGVADALFRFTEIFEFGARVSLTEAGDERMHIAVTVGGVRGRALHVEDPRRAPMFAEYKATMEQFPYEVEVARTDLVANAREHALRGAMELFWRFDWQPSIELLREQQEELRR